MYEEDFGLHAGGYSIDVGYNGKPYKPIKEFGESITGCLQTFLATFEFQGHLSDPGKKDFF